MGDNAPADPYRTLIDALGRCKRVLITTHVRPDGDALGSTAAMAMGLKHKGIAAEVMLLSKLPSKYAFVMRDPAVACWDVEQGWPAALELDRFDALLVVDTGTWSQLPGLKDWLARARFNKPKYVLDHHLTQEDWADAKLVVTHAAAAGEIVAELLRRSDVTFDALIAQALFVAIASDTGWFQFSNTRPYTFRLAAQLVEAGADTDRLYQLLYQNERAQRVALHALALRSLEILADGRLAVMSVTRPNFVDAKAAATDTEALINFPMQVKTVQVSLLFVEPPEGTGPIRVSLRSKGQVDVSKFAEPFGGGGHARAAGLKVDGDVTLVRQRVVAAMVAAIA